MEKNNEREYADFQRRLRFSNLLSLAGDSPVEVHIYKAECRTRHIGGRIIEHSVDDEQASLLVDCDGFVMMLDVGNIISLSYEPDDDSFELWIQDRVETRFQPIIKPSEAADYVADMLLDEAQRAAEDAHEEVPDWLAIPNPGSRGVDRAPDVEDDKDEHTVVPGCLCHLCTGEDDYIDGDDFGAHHHEVHGRTCPEINEEGGENTE